MADLWNLIFWLLLATAPVFLMIWYFSTEEKEKKIRQARTRVNQLRKEPVGYRKRQEPFSKEQRKLVLGFTNGKCFYCCKELSLDYWEIDHLWPMKLGGVNDLFNLVPSCKSCNKLKFIYNPFSWIVTKWFDQGELNEFELRFLKHYSVNSPSHLTNNKYWASYMEKVPRNASNFLGIIDQCMEEKERKAVYNRFIRIFSDRPEKHEVTENKFSK